MSNPEDITNIKAQVAEGIRDIQDTPAEPIVTTWEAVNFDTAREQMAALAATLATLHTVQIPNAINADVCVNESAEYAVELFEKVARGTTSQAAEDMLGQADWLKDKAGTQMHRGFAMKDTVADIHAGINSFAELLASLAIDQQAEVGEAKEIVARRTSALDTAQRYHDSL